MMRRATAFLLFVWIQLSPGKTIGYIRASRDSRSLSSSAATATEMTMNESKEDPYLPIETLPTLPTEFQTKEIEENKFSNHRQPQNSLPQKFPFAKEMLRAIKQLDDYSATDLVMTGHDLNRLYTDPTIPGGEYTDDASLLHWATFYSSYLVAEVLIEFQAEVDIVNGAGNTPLHVAAHYGLGAITDLLLRAGANPDMKDKVGDTPMCIAAREGHTEVVRILIMRHGKIDNKCSSSRTSLHHASTQDNPELLEVLLEHGAEANAVNDEEHGWTPLIYAAQAGNAKAVWILLKYDADTGSASSNTHRTALHYSSWYGHVDVIAVLLKGGANTEVKDYPHGRTPLHFSAWNGRMEATKLLVSYRADVNAVEDEVNWTPLHFAATFNHHSVTKLLVQNGAVVDTFSVEGLTPLYASIARGLLEIIAVLVDGGASKILGSPSINSDSEKNILLDIICLRQTDNPCSNARKRAILALLSES